MYPFGLQKLPVVGRKCRHLAHAVVHYADLNALCGFAYECIKDTAPHISLFNYEVFHENILLCLLEFSEHSFELVLSESEISHLSLVIQREASCPVQISAEVIRSRPVMFDFFSDVLRLS